MRGDLRDSRSEVFVDPTVDRQALRVRNMLKLAGGGAAEALQDDFAVIGRSLIDRQSGVLGLCEVSLSEAVLSLTRGTEERVGVQIPPEEHVIIYVQEVFTESRDIR